MRRLWILTLLVFLAADQGPDRAAVRLQAAIKTEVFDGNLKGAIEQYNKIIDTYKTNRAVVAEALVRMAQCYEKLGDVQTREARSTYERVVREFADQSEFADRARARLAALASAAGTAAAENAGIRIRQVWTDPPSDIDCCGSPSPDGRSLAYITDAGDLMIRDLTTGLDRHVTSLVRDWPGSIALSPLLSPQNDVIAYTLYASRPSELKEGERSQLRLYDIKSDKMRNLMPGMAPYAVAWSRDAKYILTSYRENGILTLGLLSVDTGTIRPVKRFGADQPYRYGGDLSPDGNFIAYAESPRQGEPNYDLVVIDAATGQENSHMAHPAEELLLGWTPDGRYLLFQSDRTGNWDLWAQRIENGKAVAEPLLIKSAVGRIFPLGFSGSGSFFYGSSTRGTDIYLSEVDLSGGKMTKPQKLIRDHEGLNSNCTFSPDGRYLAYLTFRGTVNFWAPNGGNPLQDTICVYSLETGKSRQYLAQMRISYMPFYPLEWSSDSRYVFFQAATPPEGSLAKKSLYKLDTNSGEITAVGHLTGRHVTSDGKTLITDFDDTENKTWHLVRRDLQTGVETELYRNEIAYKDKTRVSWSYYLGSDGKTIFLYFVDSENKTRRIFRRDIQTGTETELGGNSLPAPAFLTLSPDNRSLAFGYSDKNADGKIVRNLELISMADGTRRTLFSGSSRPLCWSLDSRNILALGSGNPQGTNVLYDLWLVPLDDKSPARIEPKIPDLLSLAIHPDGKRVALTLGQHISREYQVWVMENYLPPAKERKK